MVDLTIFCHFPNLSFNLFTGNSSILSGENVHARQAREAPGICYCPCTCTTTTTTTSKISFVSVVSDGSTTCKSDIMFGFFA